MSFYHAAKQQAQAADAARRAKKLAELASEIEERLEELQLAGDPESNHIEADLLLLQFVRAAGFPNLAAEFEAIDKYYG